MFNSIFIMRLKISIFILCGILLIIVGSCSKQKQNNSITVTLKEDILLNSTSLKADSLWFPDSIYAKRFYVYADTILIMENQKKAGNFLNIYNMHNHNLIAELLSFGEGPGELLFAQMNYDGSSMRIMDYINRKLCCVCIDKVLNENEYKPEFLSLSKSCIMTSAPVPYGDSIIYVNPYHYTNRKENISQQPPRLIASTNENQEPAMPMNFEYITFNVGQGFLGANLHFGKIFFASNEQSVIEFYNSDLQLVKTILGPATLSEANLEISGEKNGKRKVCYKGKIQPEAYRGFTTLGDKLYLLYTGKELPLDNPKEYKSYILCFDWNGNFLKSYSAPARIYALSASVKPDTFYATIMDKEDNPQIVKLTPFNSND